MRLDQHGNLVDAGMMDGGAPSLRARKLNNEQLAQLNHVEWLKDFAKITLLPTRVPMTPRRLGVGTRLEWAADYITLLEDTVKKQELELIDLKRQLSEAI
jgi:hypothetical protein